MSRPMDSTLPKAASDSFEVYAGPSFIDSVPETEEWLGFLNRSNDKKLHAMASLWFEKAKEMNGVPNRKIFTFTELAKLGTNLTLFKLTDDGRWLTTFAGDAIVGLVGIEMTRKHLDDYGDEKTLKFWLDNVKLMTDQSKPLLEYYNLDFADKEFCKCEVLNLPLMSGKHNYIDMFFAYTAVIAKPF